MIAQVFVLRAFMIVWTSFIELEKKYVRYDLLLFEYLQRVVDNISRV